MQVAFPHCTTCFGRCYPGGAALITDAKNLFEGISRLLATAPSRELPKPVHNAEAKNASENGSMPAVENGVHHGVEQTGSSGGDESRRNHVSSEKEVKADTSEETQKSPVSVS